MQASSPSFEAIQEEIAAILSIPDEELSPEDHQRVDVYLDMLASQESAKVDSFAQFIRIEGERAAAIKEEAKRLSAKAKTAENRISYLKSRYIETLRNHDLKKIKGNIYTMSLRTTPVVKVSVDPSELPEEYQNIKTTIDADKMAIKAALQSGQTIKGCALGESFSLMVR